MLDGHDLRTIVDAFGLGELVSRSGPTFRGERGQISRVETTTGTWAVKEFFGGKTDRNVEEAVAFQEAAEAAAFPWRTSCATHSAVSSSR